MQPLQKTSEEQRCVPRSRGDFVPEGMEEIAQLLLHSAPSDSVVKPLATGIREKEMSYNQTRARTLLRNNVFASVNALFRKTCLPQH